MVRYMCGFSPISLPLGWASASLSLLQHLLDDVVVNHVISTGCCCVSLLLWASRFMWYLRALFSVSLQFCISGFLWPN